MSHLSQAADAVDATDASAAAVPRHVAVVMDGNGRWARILVRLFLGQLERGQVQPGRRPVRVDPARFPKSALGAGLVTTDE